MSHNIEMRNYHFKLTYKGELQPSKRSLEWHRRHNLLTILYRRPTSHEDDTTTMYVHTTTKYISFIKDLFENTDNIELHPISLKQLKIETRGLSHTHETFPPTKTLHLHWTANRTTTPPPTTKDVMVK